MFESFFGTGLEFWIGKVVVIDAQKKLAQGDSWGGRYIYKDRTGFVASSVPELLGYSTDCPVYLYTTIVNLGKVSLLKAITIQISEKSLVLKAILLQLHQTKNQCAEPP